jgi:hypothetical protein
MNNELNNFLKDQVEAGQFQPESGDWDKFVTMLDQEEPKKKRRFFFIWWALLGSMILSGVFYLSANFNPSNKLAKNNLSTSSQNNGTSSNATSNTSNLNTENLNTTNNERQNPIATIQENSSGENLINNSNENSNINNDNSNDSKTTENNNKNSPNSSNQNNVSSEDKTLKIQDRKGVHIPVNNEKNTASNISKKISDEGASTSTAINNGTDASKISNANVDRNKMELPSSENNRSKHPNKTQSRLTVIKNSIQNTIQNTTSIEDKTETEKIIEDNGNANVTLKNNAGPAKIASSKNGPSDIKKQGTKNKSLVKTNLKDNIQISAIHSDIPDADGVDGATTIQKVPQNVTLNDENIGSTTANSNLEITAIEETKKDNNINVDNANKAKGTKSKKQIEKGTKTQTSNIATNDLAISSETKAIDIKALLKDMQLKPGSELYNKLAKTYGENNITKLSATIINAVRQELTKAQADNINDFFSQQNNMRTKYFVLAGMSINQGLVFDTLHKIKQGVTPFIGLGFSKLLNPNFGIRMDALFSSYNQINGSSATPLSNYSFGRSKDSFTVNYKKFTQVVVPFRMEYQMARIFSLYAGASASYLVDVNSQVKDGGNPLVSRWGYRDGFNKLDIAATFGFGFALTKTLGLEAFYQHGFMDLTNNNYFNNTQTHTQKRILCGLKYNFKK